MERGQPPMRAAECFVPRAASGARRRRAIDEALRFAAPRLRELAWGSKLSEACLLRALLQTGVAGRSAASSPRGRLERPQLEEQPDKRGYSRPLTARREIYKQLRLSQDC